MFDRKLRIEPTREQPAELVCTANNGSLKGR